MALVQRRKRTEEKPEKKVVVRRSKEEKIIDEGFIAEPKSRKKKDYDEMFAEKIPEKWPEPCDLILTERAPAASLEIWSRLAEKSRVNLRKKVFQNITYGQVQEAIFECGGFETNISRKLQISTYYTRQILAKNKPLMQLFTEVRENLVDEVEMHMLNKIRSGAKESVNLIMFYLKCLGKARGYVESSVNNTKKAGVKMKIVPTSEKKKKASAAIADKATANVVSFKKVGSAE